MEKLVSQIVQELTELDPDLEGQSDALHQLVEKLIKAQPEASLTENFRQELASQIQKRAAFLKNEAESEQSFVEKLLSLFKSKKLVYTIASVAFAVFALFVVLQPNFIYEEDIISTETSDGGSALEFVAMDSLEAPAVSLKAEENLDQLEENMNDRDVGVSKKTVQSEPILPPATPSSEAIFSDSEALEESATTFEADPSFVVAPESFDESLTAENVIDREKPRALFGGACEYIEISGVAKITSIEGAEAEDTCVGAVEVSFDFISYDLQVKQVFVKNNYQKITVGAGMNPPLEWVNQQKIEIGSEVRCIKKEIKAGACTPVVFEFPELDYSMWESACWSRE